MGRSDAAFIVAACNALHQLIAEVRRLRDESDRLNNVALDEHEALVGDRMHRRDERAAVRRLVALASDAVDALAEAGYCTTAARLRDQLQTVRAFE